jgi:hypothetical protein
MVRIDRSDNPEPEFGVGRFNVKRTNPTLMVVVLEALAVVALGPVLRPAPLAGRADAVTRGATLSAFLS